MTGWADWHLGEVVEAQEVYNYNAYNMANRRGARPQAFDKMIYLARREAQTADATFVVCASHARHHGVLVGLRR